MHLAAYVMLCKWGKFLHEPLCGMRYERKESLFVNKQINVLMLDVTSLVNYTVIESLLSCRHCANFEVGL